MKNLFSIIVLSLAFLACDKEGDELVSDSYGVQPKVVGFNAASSQAAFFSNVGPVAKDLRVVLIGNGNDGLLSKLPITINFSVDTAKTTAVEGTEYNFASTSRSITIPAGSSLANIPLVVNTGSLNPTQKTELVINLTSTTDGVISEKNKSIKVVFVGCITALQGNYNTFTIVGAVQSAAGPATVTKISPNVYRSTRLPGIQSAGQPLTFDFSDVCKDLTITEWEFEGTYPMFKTGGTERPTGIIISPAGNLRFDGVNLTGLSFYTNRNFVLVKI